MGLNDLVKDKREETKTRSESGGSDTKGPFIDPRPGEIKVREKSFDKIPPVDCHFCDDGVAVPVMGLSDYGSLYRCYKIFCPNSIMKHKRSVSEDELVEVRNEMELVARRRGLE